LVVVDVNFFPSFKEVEDFPARLRAFLRERAGGREGGIEGATLPAETRGQRS
jgi:hypothetical protein